MRPFRVSGHDRSNRETAFSLTGCRTRILHRSAAPGSQTGQSARARRQGPMPPRFGDGKGRHLPCTRPSASSCSFALGTGLMTSTGGCGGGDSLPREPLSGTVTLDGKPVEKGTIRFMPTAQGNASTSTETVITSGNYEVPASTGLLPGPYQVSISAVEESKVQRPRRRRAGARAMTRWAGPASRTQPADVRMREDDTRPIQPQEHPQGRSDQGGKNVFDFPLTSK